MNRSFIVRIAIIRGLKHTMRLLKLPCPTEVEIVSGGQEETN